MDLPSFIIGLVVAWIIALLVYGWNARRRDDVRVASTVPLSQHLTQVQEANERVTALEARLREEEEARASAEAQAAEAIERLRAELAERERAAAPAAATVVEAEVVAAPQPAADGDPASGPAVVGTEATPEQSNLQRVEGIGPQIEEILKNAGIDTLARLAETDVERLREILAQAGERYRLAEPRTWPEQAGLAAAGREDELAELQDRLTAGR